MKKIIFATNNRNKVEEIKNILGNNFNVISLEEAGITIDIPEPHATLEENAAEKARTIYKITGENCFSEDTGLEVSALKGEPGVKSARYAGEGRRPADNIKKLLLALQGVEDRSARFRTSLCLLLEGKEYVFEGICEGTITGEPRGAFGFGYDSIFIPAGSNRTFAELQMEEKNKFSHRKKATEKMASFLSAFGKK